MGKQTAHSVVYEVAQQARTAGRPLRDVLGEHPDITALLEPRELVDLFDPARHL